MRGKCPIRQAPPPRCAECSQPYRIHQEYLPPEQRVWWYDNWEAVLCELRGAPDQDRGRGIGGHLRVPADRKED